jgi:CelD/BcsL family acetyltransferase involved in cellulose biosynthesis
MASNAATSCRWEATWPLRGLRRHASEGAVTRPGPALRITLAPPGDLESLAGEWRGLEARADASFFQSWTWVGCVAERFADPWLLRAERDGLVGLALLNRVGPNLFLGESGDAALDAVYVEHNGPLLGPDEDLAGDLAACLRALLQAPLDRTAGWRRRLRLSGVDDAHLAAARAVGAVRLRRSQPAPYVDLAALGAAETAYLASLSANTRQQLRRSDRRYAASGRLAVRRAEGLAEALAFLDGLIVLHQASWTARGHPGAFAAADFVAFHRALLARAVPRNEAELLRIAAGDRVVGYLYNFRHRGRVLAYQSGFDYPGAEPYAKPGLTCHHAAIALARREGMAAYDFLAGDDRYKTSLANAAATLHWLDVAPRWSPRGVAWRLAGWGSAPHPAGAGRPQTPFANLESA